MHEPDIKRQLKERIAQGLHFGIEALDQYLQPDDTIYNDFVLLKSKYNDLMYLSTQQTLPYEQIELGLNKLRANLLQLVNRLDPAAKKAKDLSDKLTLQDLPNRRTNLFKLLDIHFKNLEVVRYVLNYGDRDEVYIGREAIAQIYKARRYEFRKSRKPNDPPSREDVSTFFLEYFEDDPGTFEVYFNNIRHMLAYTLQNEVEQAFFLNIIRSLLSRYELALMLYYALSGIQPGFGKVIQQSGLLDALDTDLLIDPLHLEWVGVK